MPNTRMPPAPSPALHKKLSQIPQIGFWIPQIIYVIYGWITLIRKKGFPRISRRTPNTPTMKKDTQIFKDFADSADFINVWMMDCADKRGKAPTDSTEDTKHA